LLSPLQNFNLVHFIERIKIGEFSLSYFCW